MASFIASPPQAAARPASSSNSAAQPRERELFKRFLVEKYLGRGAYGSAYRVRRHDDQKAYAVKEADVTKMGNAERQDAANEIRLLASVKHPNIVRYYEAFLDGNWLCMIMEFAACGDLAHYIKRGKERNVAFPEEVIWSFFLQIVRGVEHMHTKKIMHRDIKPANIMIGKGDIVKIGDLGIGKVLKAAVASTQIGTPSYMAPEVFKGESYTFTADIWSLGVVLYEMMSYSLPFKASGINELRTKVTQGRYPPIPTDYSPALNNLVARMLVLNPDQRISAYELLMLPEAQQRLPHLPGAREAEHIAPMLNTIHVPANLRKLNEQFPAASYDDIAAQRPRA